MSGWRIYGFELSPYSVKVRSYFRYKRLPHEWIPRTIDKQAEFDALAKLPLVPLVVAPDGGVLQDSTPIIEAVEAKHPEPSITPPDAVGGFVSALLEEWADEWMNKPMFHYRWHRPVDQASGAERIARGTNPALTGDELATVIGAVRHRMVNRLHFVGSTPETAGLIEDAFRATVSRVEAHLSRRPYLFGGRPALADFGLWGQLYELWTDPTPGAVLRAMAPSTCTWITRMVDPVSSGAWEPWSSLEPTLLPLLKDVGETFIPWTLANEAALAAGEKSMAVVLRGKRFTQEPQKYHAKSLATLRKKYSAAQTPALDGALARAGILRALRR